MSGHDFVRRVLGLFDTDTEYQDYLNKWMQLRETIEEMKYLKSRNIPDLHSKIFGNVDKENKNYLKAKAESIRLWEKIYGEAWKDV